MRFWSKLFAGSESSRNYVESDNMGTRQDTLGDAKSFWMMRTLKQRFEPYVLYTFKYAPQARRALLELDSIHVAEDTGELISTEVLTFGYYETEAGDYEAIVCGDDLSRAVWRAAKKSFERNGGVRKNDQEPVKNSAAAKSKQGPGATSEVVFIREEFQEIRGRIMTYRIHEAPNIDAAKAFLGKNPVTQPFSYTVVETPDGNYARDIDGIYKE